MTIHKAKHKEPKFVSLNDQAFEKLSMQNFGEGEIFE
jgi:hypothetical protein